MITSRFFIEKAVVLNHRYDEQLLECIVIRKEMNGSKPIEYEEQKNEKSNAQGMLGDRSGYINEHYYEYVTLKYSEIYNVTYAYIGDMRLQFNKNGTVNIR